MKWVATILAALALSGCATTPTTEQIRVEVPVPCKADPIEKPILAFKTQAKKSMTLFDKVKLLLAQDKARDQYEAKLEAVVKKCTE